MKNEKIMRKVESGFLKIKLNFNILAKYNIKIINVKNENNMFQPVMPFNLVQSVQILLLQCLFQYFNPASPEWQEEPWR